MRDDILVLTKNDVPGALTLLKGKNCTVATYTSILYYVRYIFVTTIVNTLHTKIILFLIYFT